MEKDNIITYRLYGRRALFSDPMTRVGGEKTSYHIPTYQALKGITESIYWKPTLTWEILRVRVLNPIQTETIGIRTLKMNGKPGENADLSFYNYLKDVAYEVEVRFIWNENRPDLAHDRDEHKHFFMAKRYLERGGRRDIFLGARECQGYVEPATFGHKKGHYDQTPKLSFGLMVHGLTYPDEATRPEEKGHLSVRLFTPEMAHGVISFPKPEDCTIRQVLRKASPKAFDTSNFSGLSEFVDFFAGGE